MNKSYLEKLKDPRWQKKRLEIFERDDFTCTACYSGNETLSVHHLFYLKDTEPWDYPNELLYTLCENCHKNIKKCDYAGELLKHIFKYGFTDFANYAIKKPTIWLYDFYSGAFSNGEEVYKSWIEDMEYLKSRGDV